MSFTLDEHLLLQFLNQHGLEPSYEKGSGQIYISFMIAGFEVPVFFVLRKETGLLQTVAYLPYELKEDTMSNVARLLHLFNKELDMPGFGMDEQLKITFYRSAIPCIDGQANEDFVRLYIAATKLACETFMQAIGMVTAGTMTFEELTKTDPGYES